MENISKLSPRQGRLLVAEPFMRDPFFKRSVVLLAEHNEEGTVGFILNKPMQLNLDEAVVQLEGLTSPLFFGGPVQKNSLFFIHTLGEIIEESKPLLSNLYWGGNFESLKELITGGEVKEKYVRFFAGYAGWDVNQLATEMKDNSWIVAKTDADFVMKTKPEDVWKNALKKLGKDYEIMSNYPEDPSLN